MLKIWNVNLPEICGDSTPVSPIYPISSNHDWTGASQLLTSYNRDWCPVVALPAPRSRHTGLCLSLMTPIHGGTPKLEPRK